MNQALQLLFSSQFLLALSDGVGPELFGNLAVGHTGGGELQLLIKPGIAEHQPEKQCRAASQTIL